MLELKSQLAVTVVKKLNSRKHVEQELKAVRFDCSDTCSGRYRKAINTKIFTGVSVNFQNFSKYPQRNSIEFYSEGWDSIITLLVNTNQLMNARLGDEACV
jgi:hypothetical protein